jgi:hypothetical protein
MMVMDQWNGPARPILASKESLQSLMDSGWWGPSDRSSISRHGESSSESTFNDDLKPGGREQSKT